MDKQEREAKQMVKNLTFKEKFKHYVYYYKGWIIAVATVLVFAMTIIYQVAMRERFDVEIASFVSVPITDEQKIKLEEYLEQYVDDIDENGEKNVGVKVNFLGTTDGMSTGVEYTMTIQQKLMAELAANMNCAYIFDEKYYTDYSSENAVFDYIRENSFKLSESAIMREIFGDMAEKLYWCPIPRPENAKVSENTIKAFENTERLTEIIKNN